MITLTIEIGTDPKDQDHVLARFAWKPTFTNPNEVQALKQMLAKLAEISPAADKAARAMETHRAGRG